MGTGGLLAVESPENMDLIDRSFFKDLDTERLLLKNISLADADFFFQEFSNPVVCKYMVDEEPFQTIDDAIKWINIYNNDVIAHNRRVIISKETNQRLGTCGFHNWDKRNNKVEIGCDLLPEYWGKGYMSEALSKALDFAFREMKVNRISAHVHVKNTRSMKLLEKLGFKKEGILREEYFFRGKYHDHYLYSLLRSDKR